MIALKDSLSSTFIRVTSNILLALCWSVFLYVGAINYSDTHKLSVLVLIFSEAILVLMFLIRAPAKTTSTHILDWILAFMGTFVTTLFRPNLTPQSLLGEALVLAGVILSLLAIISLNRSFALVAAERTIKTEGMYAFVRHPIYTGYFVMYAGFIVENPTAYNFIILILCVVFQILRIKKEESLLKKNEIYTQYTHTVRWRLLPYIY